MHRSRGRPDARPAPVRPLLRVLAAQADELRRAGGEGDPDLADLAAVVEEMAAVLGEPGPVLPRVRGCRSQDVRAPR
jgi:hypothetical protein